MVKSLKNFELSCRVVLSEMTALANDNAKLALALEAERRKHQQAMHTAAAEQRALREQVVTATRSKKRAERKHDASLTKARERAAYYRSKLAEYRRELISAKSIIRNQKHD